MTTLESRMDGRMTALEEKVERRLQDTRPLWESVLEQLKEMNGRLTRLEQESKDLRRLVRLAFADLARSQEDLEERVEKLEARLAS